MKKQFYITLLFIGCMSLQSAHAQFVPDSSFSQNGYFITNYPGLGTYTHKIHELDNGDILAIGTSEGEIRIWKYDATGQLITSFGNNGIASNPALDAETGNMHSLEDYEIYDNGKIMVLSKLSWINPTYFDSSKFSIALSSFNADGSINTGFAGVGYIKSNPNPLFEFNPYSLLIDQEKNNDIYVGGEAYERGNTSCPMGKGKWFISKYRESGTLDLAFNNTGYILESAALLKAGIQSPHGRLRDMAFMANGSVRAVGAFHNFDRAFFDFAIKPDGTFDNSFGLNGKTVYDVNYDVLHIEVGTSAKILNDGTVLFYTKSYTANEGTYRLVKHKIDGTKDSTYGLNGLCTFTYPSNSNARFVYKSDNSLLLTYYKTYGADQKIEFVRVHGYGAVDSTFGINGLQITQPIVPDVYINPSSVMDGIWNKNETCVFLASINQPLTYRNYGIFKYKWPGLTPLGIAQHVIDAAYNTYPNPVNAGNILHVKGATAQSTFKLLNLQGIEIPTNLSRVAASEVGIDIPANCPAGIYYLYISNHDRKTTISLVIR